MTDEPLTDEELDRAEREWRDAMRIPGMDDFNAVSAAMPVFERLIAEVRRLRRRVAELEASKEILRGGQDE